MPLIQAQRSRCNRGWTFILAGLLFLSSIRPVLAQRETQPPRLVVFVVIDQFRGDYLTRFGHLFGQGGFRRLMDNGAFFTNAYYSYGYTTTAPGHATIATGRNPREHGIVANDWYQGKDNQADRAAVYDHDVHILVGTGGKTEGRSPRNLIGTTIGDQMKLANSRSRVFTVAIKDRAAILLGGQRPDGAFWFDITNGEFVSSDWYMAELPAYVRDFNTRRWADRFLNNKWDRLLPPAAYEITQPINPEWVGKAAGLGPVFPHILPKASGQPGRAFYTAVATSPFGHEMTIEMARRIVTSEKLGMGDAVDFLGISLSSFDTAGHIFGPESAEMMDFALRTDRQIAELLELLDRSVGLNRCIVVLSGDHGCTSAPLMSEHMRLGGNRIDMGPVVKNINASMAKVAALPGNGNYIKALEFPWVHLDPAWKELEVEARGHVLSAAKNAWLAVNGVANVYTSEELAGAAPPSSDPHRLRAWESYFPGRSADLFVDFSPYYSSKGGDVADHSDGSNQSRHVPIVIMGGSMRQGRYFTPADPRDIVPTVAALLGIEAPLDASGRVLSEGINVDQFTR